MKKSGECPLFRKATSVSEYRKNYTTNVLCLQISLGLGGATPGLAICLTIRLRPFMMSITKGFYSFQEDGEQ